MNKTHLCALIHTFFIQPLTLSKSIAESVLQIWIVFPTADCKSVAIICRVVGD